MRRRSSRMGAIIISGYGMGARLLRKSNVKTTSRHTPVRDPGAGAPPRIRTPGHRVGNGGAVWLLRLPEAGYSGAPGRREVMKRTAIGLALGVWWAAACAPTDQEVPASSPATESESPSTFAAEGSP